jgi:hypothetical protein
VLIAGDDKGAKRKVSQLISDGGLRPLDADWSGRPTADEQDGQEEIGAFTPVE